MGFSSIVSQIMLVFTMIGIITLVVVTYKGYVSDTNTAIQMQEKKVQEKINTNILITNITYNNPELNITVKNIGGTILKLEDIDIFVDDIRIPRKEANRTFTLTQNIVNKELFDPAEKLLINVTIQLGTGYHRVEVLTQQGVRNAEIFEI